MMPRLLQHVQARLIAILLLALLVRLLGIASRSIWYDEAFSILLSEKGPSAILAGTLSVDSDVSAAEEHPPAYYFMLWGWMQIFGRSLISVRTLSILAGIGVVFLVFLLGTEIFNRRVGFGAAVFAAILPFQVHYAQEIRMYVFLELWLCLAAYAYWRGTTSGNWYWWGIFSLSAALAQYTHNLAVMYLALLALIPVLRRDWISARAVSLAGLAGLILYFPWLTHLPSQLAKIQAGYWIERPDVSRFFTLLLIDVTNLPLPNSWLLPGLLVSASVVVLSCYQTIRAARDGNPDAENGSWLCFLSFAPPLSLWLVSQWRPVYLERVLLPSHAFFCVWLAWALMDTKLPKILRSAALGALVIGATMGLIQHATYRGFPYAPYQVLSQSLRSRILPGDIIIHSNKLSALPSIYFDRDLPQIIIADPPASGTDTLALATQQVLGLVAAPDIESAVGHSQRVWFIIFRQSIREYEDAGLETHPHLAYLTGEFELTAQETWDELELYVYTRASP